MIFTRKLTKTSEIVLQYLKILPSQLSGIHQLVKKHIPTVTEHDLLNFKDLDSLEKNNRSRKTSGNIEKFKKILRQLEIGKLDENARKSLVDQLKCELLKFPNRTHPEVLKNQTDKPLELAKFNSPPKFTSKPKTFAELSKFLNIVRMDHLGNFTGHKSYYFMGQLAEMEHALVQYALDHLSPHGFKLISVPDVLPAEIIEGCGMQTSGDRTQVYKLKSLNKCLSGTSEMALAGYFKDKIIDESELPLKLAAASRCFRAETSGLQDEKGIYRVHQFTKVEMFSVCSEQESDSMLEHFKEIEIDLFQRLGIHFKLLDMPPSELGAPAYRKYDIESWMPGRNMWGEISSCSNCTDYQAKRLNIRYRNQNGELKFVHTVNGTACAVPRLLITLLETFQDLKASSIGIPKILQKYLRGQTEITKKKALPELKLVKHIDWPTKFK